MYDPELGRWLSEDPIGFSSTDFNLVRYAKNASTYFTDPDGFKSKPLEFKTILNKAVVTASEETVDQLIDTPDGQKALGGITPDTEKRKVSIETECATDGTWRFVIKDLHVPMKIQIVSEINKVKVSETVLDFTRDHEQRHLSVFTDILRIAWEEVDRVNRALPAFHLYGVTDAQVQATVSKTRAVVQQNVDNYILRAFTLETVRQNNHLDHQDERKVGIGDTGKPEILEDFYGINPTNGKDIPTFRKSVEPWLFSLRASPAAIAALTTFKGIKDALNEERRNVDKIFVTAMRGLAKKFLFPPRSMVGQ